MQEIYYPKNVHSNVQERTHVPIGIVGDTLSTHRVLTAYVALYNNYIHTLDRKTHASLIQKTRFYVIPEGSNMIGAFLADRDLWYNRQVYTPFKDPIALLPIISDTCDGPEYSDSTARDLSEPQVEGQQTSKDSRPTGLPTLPQHCRRSLLQDYFQDAEL